MTTFMPPPPAANFLAFHPQDNNIIAIGMDDSSIQIYNVRVDEVSLLPNRLKDTKLSLLMQFNRRKGIPEKDLQWTIIT